MPRDQLDLLLSVPPDDPPIPSRPAEAAQALDPVDDWRDGHWDAESNATGEQRQCRLRPVFDVGDPAELRQHPLNAALPPMTGAEFEALCLSVETTGLLCPIVLYEGDVLDGWHRLQACLSASVPPEFVEYIGPASAFAYIHAANMHRRGGVADAAVSAALAEVMAARALVRQEAAHGRA